jgi:hypothetical protein
MYTYFFLPLRVRLENLWPIARERVRINSSFTGHVIEEVSYRVAGELLTLCRRTMAKA